ncbi:CHASE2 domain-containing protein [Novosphingobium soli]|uniref:CHASE2 domain-containing protein n=1 Tax=Novosphingobium soli TaxID=574956 RepID=A0ABV6CWU4_9SPHN
MFEHIRRVLLNGLRDIASFRAPRVTLRRWARSFVPFAIILLLDPLGCSQTADLYSEAVVLRLMAPFHSGAAKADQVASTRGQTKVAVVLIDQAWLDAIAPPGERGLWPPPRSQQISLVLQPILAQGAEALLIDYTFHADRLQPPALADGLLYDPEAPAAIRDALEEQRVLHSGVTPSGWPARLVLGSKPAFLSVPPACRIPFLNPGEVAQADDVAPTLRDWPSPPRGTGRRQVSEVEIVSLRRHDPDQHYSLFTYRMGQPPESRCAGETIVQGADYLASPAAVLFHAYCEREGLRARHPLCPQILRVPSASQGTAATPRAGYAFYRVAPSTEDTSARLPMTVAPVWPGFRSAAMSLADSALIAGGDDALRERIAACHAGGMGFLSSKPVLAWRLFWTKLLGIEGGADAACRYGVDVYSMGKLMRLAEIAPEMQPLKGRYVIVGTEIASVPDHVSSVLYEDVPGAVLHGVVLENLISSDQHAVFGHGGISAWDATKLVLAIGFILSLVPAVIDVDKAADRMMRIAHRQSGKAEVSLNGIARVMLIVTALTVAACIPLLIGLVLSLVAQIPPVNWVSLLPSLAWVYGSVLDANERDIEKSERRRIARSTNRYHYWFIHFIVPMTILVVVTIIGSFLFGPAG